MCQKRCLATDRSTTPRTLPLRFERTDLPNLPLLASVQADKPQQFCVTIFCITKLVPCVFLLQAVVCMVCVS